MSSLVVLPFYIFRMNEWEQLFIYQELKHLKLRLIKKRSYRLELSLQQNPFLEIKKSVFKE